MGILDTAKMVRKAQKAKSQMGKITVAGQSKSGNVALLINGLNEILEIQFEDEVVGDASKLEKEVIEAYDDAKKQLEREMANTMDMDSIRDMFS